MYVPVLLGNMFAVTYCGIAHTGRDADYCALNIQFTIDVVKASVIIGLFPEFLKPWVVRPSGYFIICAHDVQIGRTLVHKRPSQDRAWYATSCAHHRRKAEAACDTWP